MAGDWIKMRGNLWDDPRVARLCDITDKPEATIVGGLYWLWATADQHTEDGGMPGLTTRAIDRKTGIDGFAQALCTIGWLTDHPEGVRIVKFTEHNGSSAKRRCADAQRKAGVRSLSASDADILRTGGGHPADEMRRSAELEKRREEKSREDVEECRTPSNSVDLGREAEEPVILSKPPSATVSRAARQVAPPTPDDVDAQVWTDWLALRKAKRAPVTATVIEGARKQASIAGMSLEAFLQVWCRRGSQGLEAAWLKPEERGRPTETARERAARERVASFCPAVAAKAPNALEYVDDENRVG